MVFVLSNTIEVEEIVNEVVDSMGNVEPFIKLVLLVVVNNIIVIVSVRRIAIVQENVLVLGGTLVEGIAGVFLATKARMVSYVVTTISVLNEKNDVFGIEVPNLIPNLTVKNLRIVDI